MTIKITRTEKKIRVSSPYNADLPYHAKCLGGKWDNEKREWIFDRRFEELVKKLYQKLYSEWDTPIETVTLRCITNYFETDKTPLLLLGRPIARATSRDSGAYLCEGVVMECGSIGSGGSCKNWETIVHEDTIFRILDFPKNFINKISEPWIKSFEVVEELPTTKIDYKKLVQERENLMEAISKINLEISNSVLYEI